MKSHLEAFGEEDQQILLLLTREDPDSSSLDHIDEAAQDQGVTFGSVTFSTLIDALIGDDGILGKYERDLQSLVRDYENFCSEEGLLP
jgi:hypothetical protein